MVDNRTYDPELLRRFINDSPGFDCLSSHRLSLDLPLAAEGFRAVALSVVRDPVARFFSHYYYLRDRDLESRRYTNLKQLSPAAFADHVIETPLEHLLFDYEYRFLTKNVADASLDRIAALVDEDRLFLLPLERFDEGLLVLRHAFPELIGDIRYSRRRVSAKEQHASPAAADKNRPHMQREQRLLEVANLRRANRRLLWLRERPARALRARRLRLGGLLGWR